VSCHQNKLHLILITDIMLRLAPFRLPCMLSASGASTAGDLTLSLPSSASIRWLASHKAAVIIAIRAGAITFSEACERYRLSPEELMAWESAFDQGGMAALQIKYRSIALKKSD
jgi:Protein of unknown function (DUF1153)